MHWEGVIRHYWDYLPLDDERHVVILLEGNTPLIPAKSLTAAIGLDIDLSQV